MKRGMRLLIAGVTVAVVLAAAAVLVVPPPLVMLRSLAVSSATWLLADPAQPGEGRIRMAVKKTLGAYIQSALATHVAARVNASGDEPDERVLARIIVAVQRASLNQYQLYHDPRGWPFLVSGLGRCDQINGAVAAVAAHRFEKAQIYALYVPEHKTSPHTIGRVWSAQRHDWLYFDAFYVRPLIFTKRPDAAPEFLPVDASKPITTRGEPDRSVYGLTGWVMNEYRATFGAYLFSKVFRSRSPEMAAPPIDPIYSASPAPAPDPRINEDAFRRLARQYVAARIDHIVSGHGNAAAYRDIASDWEAATAARASELAAAARVLASSPR